MLTIPLGKKFVNYYNKENSSNLSPKEIFRTVIAPIAFQDNKHLMCWQNSKFFYFQNKLNQNKATLEDFPNVLDEFCNEVENEGGNIMDSLKVFGGFACAFKNGTFKSETTNFCYAENMYYSVDERYFSWIGALFALRIGDYLISLNSEKVVAILWESIKAYREALNSNTDLKGYQINTWNTIYLYTYFTNKDELENIISNHTGNSKKGIELLNNVKFENLIFLIGKYITEIKHLECQVISDRTVTSGSILIDVPYVSRMADVYKLLYEEINEDFNACNFNRLFGYTQSLFHKAITCGAVYEGMLNPLTLVKSSDKLSGTQIKNIKIFLEHIMTETELTLVKNFISALTKSTKNTRRNLIANFDKCYDKADFINEVARIKKETGYSDVSFENLIEYIISTTNVDLKTLCAYINFNIQ